jgi:hypothetical protein
MADQETRNPQHSDSQKSSQKVENQPNPAVQPNVPTGQPKSPQPEQEKHDQSNKKQA